MRAVLAIVAYFSFAVFFGIGLVRLKLNERYEYQGCEEEETETLT